MNHYVQHASYIGYHLIWRRYKAFWVRWRWAQHHRWMQWLASMRSRVVRTNLTSLYSVTKTKDCRNPVACCNIRVLDRWGLFDEENGIGKAESNKMPTVGLFGPQFSRLFRDIIAAIGSYGDIYERNLAELTPCRGLNLLLIFGMNSHLQFHVPGMLQ